MFNQTELSLAFGLIAYNVYAIYEWIFNNKLMH